MTGTAQPLMVIGHKNPDTDSICSAIAYAQYKQQVQGVPAIPYRAGNLNPQTTFVLKHFGVAAPELLLTILPKVSDIMIQGKDLLVLSEDDPVGAAQRIIIDRRFAFLPVLDQNGKYSGKISSIRLAELPQDIARLGRTRRVRIRSARFIQAIQGVVKFGQPPQVLDGSVWLPGLSHTPSGSELPVLAVLPNGHEQRLSEALDRGTALIVCCGTDQLGECAEKLLDGRPSCVVTTMCDPIEVATQVCLSMPLRDFVERQHPTFKPHDLVRDVRQAIRPYNEGGFIVVDDEGMVSGILTRVTFLTPWRFRVALVDHNELSQAVDGIEEASVEEVIDHHRLGYRSTDLPITFINKVVGCTATIIAELYRNSHQAPPSPVAGLMLAAILSDTVILQSPTTTPLDQEMAQWLAGIAEVQLHSFGAQMFAAGCVVEGVDPAQIIRQDLKIYQEGRCQFGVSQMETVGFDAFNEVRDALAAQLAQARHEAQCQFSCLMVTDITSSTSLLLCTGESKFIEAISYPRAGESLFEMRGVLSRKKQMVPYLIDLIRRLGPGGATQQS